MKDTPWHRFGYFLERIKFLPWFLKKYDGEITFGKNRGRGRYVNRINGHLVLGKSRKKNK